MARTHPTSVVAALVANAGAAVAKLVAFAFTGSSSMFSEAVHSVADTSNQVLLLVGHARARRRPDPQHPFGHGRDGYFWALLVAVLLFFGGAVISLREGYTRLRHPHEISSLGWAIAVLVVAFVLEAFALGKAVETANRTRRGTWWDYVRQTKDPENVVVLLEDSAACFGLIVALIGVAAASLTGDPRYDAAGSLVIGVLLAIVAAVLAREMRSLLIGEAASSTDVAELKRLVRADQRVDSLLDLRTMTLGAQSILVTARLEMRPQLTLAQAEEALANIRDAVRDVLGPRTIVYLEPTRLLPNAASSSEGGSASCADQRIRTVCPGRMDRD